MSTSNETVLLLIRNIPSNFHSSELRAFFSLLIERGAFKCFHFRHRPEKLETNASETDTKKTSAPGKTLCCFVRIRGKYVPDLFEQCNGKHWEDEKNQLLSTRCHVLRVRIAGGKGKPGPDQPPRQSINQPTQYLTRQERAAEQRYHVIHQELRESDVNDLIEMNPPAVMPHGNVGTPTRHFLELIRNCQMPAGLIKKLGLRFPKGRKNRKFGQVGMDYGNDVVPGQEYGEDEEDEDVGPTAVAPVRKFEWFNKDDAIRREGDDGDDLDNDDCQEWERHEALNNDVTTHERNKERLFEDDAEVVWEKGGPGIVWNMDANFWHEQNGGDDIDEATDDWDVDMSCYYEDEKNCPGDRDARDFMQMRREKEMRAGAAPSVFRKPAAPLPSQLPRKSFDTMKAGTFEKFTKGIGRKLLEKSGWQEGSGVGKWKTGIVDPVRSDGQLPYSKRGFGFQGKAVVKKSSTDATSLINKQAVLEPGNFGIQLTTCYDSHDAGDTLKRRAASSRLSYRSTNE